MSVYTASANRLREPATKTETLIKPDYISALLQLHKRLAKKRTDWMVGGELSEALRAVNVKPKCVEIVTTKRGAVEIFLAVKDCNPTGVFFQTQRLSRNAKIGGKEYPAYIRSHYFEFNLANVPVKVHGDLQYKISNGEWGAKMDFTPEHIYLVGVKTAIMPMHVLYTLYQGLGWSDRAKKISPLLLKRPHN
ncbi:MAG: hypothetical protein ACBZ72_06845 [Candidatus Bathyarchaeia archaeon]|jgi:hypothetical protein